MGLINLARAADTFVPIYRAVFAYDSQARLPPVKAPTLVVDDTGDFEPEIVRRGEAVASLIPNCRTRMMKGEDGNIIWWRSKALADVMEEFFERR